MTPAGTLLLVDDEPSLRRLANRILSAQGYTVLEGAHGQEGLDQIMKDVDKAIQILVTDIVMPVMDGHKLAVAARLIRPDLKILFVSGYVDQMVPGDFMSQYGIQLLKKPFTPTELAGKVREIIAGPGPRPA